MMGNPEDRTPSEDDTEDVSEWGAGLFQSSVVGLEDSSIVEEEQTWPGSRRPSEAKTERSNVFERELTSPLSSLSSTSEDEGSETITRTVSARASDRDLHGRLMRWMSLLEETKGPARVSLPSGGYNTHIEIFVHRGAFVSSPFLRGQRFFDLEFKREVPEVFDRDPGEHESWWGDSRGKAAAARMLLRLMVRGASLSFSDDALEITPCDPSELPTPGGALDPIELLLDPPREADSGDAALALNARCVDSAQMSWTWRRSGKGVGMLGTCSNGATISAASSALEAAHAIMESPRDAGALGLVMIRFEDTTWTVCWTGSWLSLQLHANTHIGRVMNAYRDLET
jgi:hypothetical protein